MVKLDIGCGENKISSEYIGVDQAPAVGVDVVWDLNIYPYPFMDNSVDEVYCSHFIEHVDNVVSFITELYRIMKPTALCHVIAPFWSHVNTWRDPTHKRGFADWTLFIFDKEWRESHKKGCYGITTDFSVVYWYEIDEAFLPIYIKMSDDDKQFALSHYNNVVQCIHYNLTKKAK